MMRNTRLYALLTCAALAVAISAPAARTAEPGSGMAGAAGDRLTWSGGPFTSANASTGTCVEGASCDTFLLQLLIPEDQVASASFGIKWQDSTNDFDLFVFDQDGNERDNSAASATESEQVTIGGLELGTYRVVTNAFATVNATYGGTITVDSLATPPPEEELELSAQLGFDDETIVDFGAGSGEPFIRADNEGNIFDTVPFGLSTTMSMLWKSVDGGRSYIPLGTPVVRDSVIGAGGGDSHVDFDANNNLYFVDLSGACITAAVSLDGGNTFPPERTNQIVCASEQSPGAIGDDRQWVGAFGDGIGYTTFRNLTAGSFWLFRTANAGLDWDGGRRLGNVSQSGPFNVDKQKRWITVTTGGGATRSGEAILSYQVFYRGTNLRVFRVADFGDGTPLIVDDLSVVDPGESVSNVFPAMAVDRAGNLHAAWSQGAHTVYMTSSADFGETWSEPAKVSSNAGTNIMPWIVAGDAGRVDVVWYHGSLKGNPNDPGNSWHIFMAQSLDAFAVEPEFRHVRVSQTPIHFGEICLRGLGCDIDGADRSFLEYPSITIDAEGAAVVTFNDNTNQLPVTYVMSRVQNRGPSLFESVGILGDEPGAVSIDAPADGATVESSPSFKAAGTHSLSPANFDRDEAGDARFPDHGPFIGGNIPALDIRSVSVSEDADDVTFTMSLADLSGIAAAPAQSGGDGVAYVIQWEFEDDIFWTGAEVRGGVPVFQKGIIGAVSTTPDSPKYYTFRTQPDQSLGVRGAFDGNTMTVSVPRDMIGDPAGGDSLFTVTGYALSQRGPFTPTTDTTSDRDISPPIQVDASGAFSYKLGDGARRDGVVEVSPDDATFGDAHRAALVDVTGGDDRWEMRLGELPSGPHRLYVRQQIDGRDPSPVAMVDFVVPETVARNVSDLLDLIADNSSFDNGVAAFDLRLRNMSQSPIFTPLRAEITEISSASGNVTAANADNDGSGAGAFWRYDAVVGGDGELSPTETSGIRRPSFENPDGAAFTVRLTVIGHVKPGSAGSASTASADGEQNSREVTGAVFEITLDPVLNAVRAQFL